MNSKEWLDLVSIFLGDDHYRIVAREANPDNKLMEELLRMNAEIPQGAFGLKDDNIIFSHCILGGHHLDEYEFLHSL